MTPKGAGKAPVDHSPRLLTLRSAARRLGIDPRQLRAAIRSGALEAYQPGSRVCYVDWRDVLRWLRAQRVPSCDHARRRVAEIVSKEEQKETAAG